MALSDHNHMLGTWRGRFVVAGLAALCLASARAYPDTQPPLGANMTNGEWSVVLAKVDREIVGVFMGRKVDPVTGGYCAFYFVRGAETWTPWVYPGADLGASVIKAQEVFNLGTALEDDAFLSTQVRQTLESGEELPATTYVQPTNGLIGVAAALGYFGGPTTFPEQLIGSDQSANYGVVSIGDLGDIPQEATNEPTCLDVDIIVDVMSMVLNDMAAGHEGLLQYTEGVVNENGETEWVATNSPLLEFGSTPCFGSVVTCGAWGPWGPWTQDYCTATPGGGAVCWYKRTRTRSCTTKRYFCCIKYWTCNWIDTDVEKDNCVEDSGGCLGCPATPSCF